MNIGYLGPQGTFSYEALKTFLSTNKNIKSEVKEAELLPSINFRILTSFMVSEYTTPQIKMMDRKIFVPVENSIGGTITSNLDSLVKYEHIYIEAEHVQPIRHYIGSLTGDFKDIKTLMSHEQPIEQCENYITFQIVQKVKSVKNEKGGESQSFEIKKSSSTTEAVEQAKKDKTIAAIAPYQALIDAGLILLEEKSIEDNPNNSTRFVLIGRDKAKLTGDDKTSIAITLPADKAGALYEVLGVLANSEPPINMTKIESRPTKDEMGEYWFFIDIEGHQDDPHIGKALEQIKAKSKEYKFLGSYPRFRK